MSWSTDLPVPARALAICAHPDDIELQAGATLAKWAAAGCVLDHLICTDGSKGTWDADADTAALVARRQDEQREAAARLGAKGTVAFLGYVDGELESGLDARGRVARAIREVRPDVVIGHDPWKRYRLHPDHRHAGLLAVEGVVAARDPHFFREHALPHHRPSAILLFEADAPDHVERVSEADLSAKLAALEAHESQLLSTMAVDTTSAAFAEQLGAFRQRIRDEAAAAGALVGADLGEQFKLLTDL